MAEQPKTLEDYKDVVKILKLKIIKQKNYIQELQNKVKQYEHELSSFTMNPQSNDFIPNPKEETDKAKLPKDFDTSTLKGKAAVMYLFLQGCKKFGITPESIFRIADFTYKNQVESDYFRTVLSKIKLNLTPKQISCLIFIFDQNCTGFILRQDYHHSLHAYQVSLQDSALPYNQQCLLKIAALLNNDKVDLAKFYEEMDARAKNIQKSDKKDNPRVDANIFEYQMKKLYGKKVNEREIIGAFNQIDLQSQGFIDRTNFLYCVTSFINRLLYQSYGEENMNSPNKKSNFTGQSNLLNDPNLGNYLANMNGVADSRVKNEANALNSAKQFVNSHISITIPQNENTKVSVLNVLINEHGVKLSQIYEELMQLSFTKRITLQKFKKTILNIKDSIPTQLIVFLFKEIDVNHKGSIYIQELIQFFLLNSTDCDMIYRLLGKYFYNNDLTAEKFMFMHGLEPESDISKAKFLQIMNKMFTSESKSQVKQSGIQNAVGQPGEEWNHVWNAFDRNNRGVTNVGNIIKTWQKYEM